MHDTAMRNAKRFFDVYVRDGVGRQIVEIGSQDVNGSLRTVCPSGVDYVGVDFVEGPGVDVVLSDPYRLPVPSSTVDAVLSSSCFEHSEMFWLLYLEIMRLLKPGGLFYLNVPANGWFHRYPVDCYRFYPDSANALAKWGRLHGLRCTVLEQYTCNQADDGWNDYVAVFLKDESECSRYPRRIIDEFSSFRNGSKYPELTTFINPTETSEDQRPALRKLLRLTAQRLGIIRVPDAGR
jgi:SAM-dependent methyltransferase